LGDPESPCQPLYAGQHTRQAAVNAPPPGAVGPLGDWAGRLTVFGAELAYVGLAAYLAWITFAAQAGQTPGVSGTVAGATGALAAAFGVGYATVLGVEASDAATRSFATGEAPSKIQRALRRINGAFSLNSLLGLGVLLYMTSGALLGIAYVTKSGQSPAVVRTIAIAFGGYVISFIGMAYKQYGR
jgi:hypothetical protein